MLDQFLVEELSILSYTVNGFIVNVCINGKSEEEDAVQLQQAMQFYSSPFQPPSP